MKSQKNIPLINKKNITTISLIIADGIATFFALLCAYFLRDKGFFRIYLDAIQPIEVYLQALPAAILLLFILFVFFGLYDPKQRVTKISELYNVLQAITLWTLIIMAGSYLAKFDYSRIIVIQMYFYTSFFVITARLIVRNLHKYLFSNGFGRINILIIGTGKYAQDIAKRLHVYRLVGFHLVGFIGNNTSSQLTVLGPLSKLNTIIKNYHIDEVYIANPTLSQEKILTIIAKCPHKQTKFKVISKMFDLITGSVDIRHIESIPSLDLSKINFPFWKKLYKRLLDIVIAGFGIFITLPTWVVIILLIKLDSRGEAILIQDRIGLNGKPFKIYKFRTMRKDTPLYKKAPVLKTDQRVTPIGKFLRRTSLDELPQLINILKGDMSIVGPRPEMPFIVKKYNEWEKRRLAVKPGLTGLWQILGRKDLPLSENLEYDFYYINNQSLILDIVIIIKTIPLVIFGKGAY